jgi:3-oxoacyl-(acyl-carrier-protein) synthase
VAVSDRVGLYVGLQQIALDYCSRFIQSSYREGPAMASPLFFAESVANNVATHASLTLGLKTLAQTFIGTRAAGIQAVIAAAEDVESGLVGHRAGARARRVHVGEPGRLPGGLPSLPAPNPPE